VHFQTYIRRRKRQKISLEAGREAGRQREREGKERLHFFWSRCRGGERGEGIGKSEGKERGEGKGA
jgi:hypothetical protein